MEPPPSSQEIVSPYLPWSRRRVSREFLGETNQVAEVNLEVEFQLYSWRQKFGDDDIKRFLRVSLEGSCGTPNAEGTLAWNRDDKRGWFTHGVIIEIWWEKATEAEVWIRKKAPETTAQESSSSLTSSIDFNIGTGTFGGTGTSSASMGGSISKSWSVSMEDFKVQDLTAKNKIRHVYKLAASTGGKYNEPEDLVDTSPAGAWSGIFEGKVPGQLYGLTDRATSNIEIASQVLFETTNNFSAKRRLFVTMEFQTCWVEKTFQGVRVDVRKQFQSTTAVIDEVIDFASVN